MIWWSGLEEEGSKTACQLLSNSHHATRGSWCPWNQDSPALCQVESLSPLHSALPQAGSAAVLPLHCATRPGEQSYVVKEKGAQTPLALSGKAVSNKPLKIPAIWETNFRTSFVLSSIIVSSTGIRGSQIQMGIEFAISFAPCSTTSPNSYLDLLCPFLLLFSCYLTRVWISQPGQI